MTDHATIGSYRLPIVSSHYRSDSDSDYQNESNDVIHSARKAGVNNFKWLPWPKTCKKTQFLYMVK